MKESSRAKRAWAIYAARGGSLDALSAHFRECRARGETVPTVHVSQLKRWSAAFGWQDRLDEIAKQAVDEAEARLAAEIRDAMTTGLATPHERVKLLKHMVGTMAVEFDEEEKRWLPDVKQIGSGEDSERVDIVRFNGSLVERIYDGLDGLAKETGGRQTKIEHSGPDGGAIPIREIVVHAPADQAG